MCFWRRKRRPDISILVPFRDNGEHRTRVWHWLKRYWEANLPNAEIIVGTTDHWPFSKTQAVNEAARKAKGKIFVILDADAYMDATKLNDVCQQLILDREQGKRTWAMVYDKIFYVSRNATEGLLELPPCEPFWFDSPPPSEILEKVDPLYGHRFGAMALAMPREAFECVNGMDNRFHSWGGEDLACLTSLDTLWGLHEVFANDMLHLWHHREGSDAQTRRWPGQPDYGPANSRLAHKYVQANGYPSWMRALVDEDPL